MKNNNTTPTKEISKETYQIIEALDHLIKMEDLAMGYYWDTYGEKTPLWEESAVKKDIETLSASLRLLLGDSVSLHLTDLNNNQI